MKTQSKVIGLFVAYPPHGNPVNLYIAYRRVPQIHIIEAVDACGALHAELRWSPISTIDYQLGEIMCVMVLPCLRRQGLATSMYFLAKRLDPEIRHSSHRSWLGDKWARSVGGVVPSLLSSLGLSA